MIKNQTYSLEEWEEDAVFIVKGFKDGEYSKKHAKRMLKEVLNLIEFVNAEEMENF